MRNKVIMGNWKLNGSKSMVTSLINEINTGLEPLDTTSTTVIVAPPAPYLGLAQTLIKESAIKLGAQNCDIHNQGAFTGDTAPEMLAEFNVSHVIIGHSERRQYHQESNEFIAQKFKALKAQKLTPVLCIGETEAQNDAGETLSVCSKQLKAVIDLVGIEAFEDSIIAYEPIWAIGTGKAATAEQAQNTHFGIRQYLASFSEAIAQKQIIQYGGSVKASNAKELFSQNDIDGALIGGAALDSNEFLNIIAATIK